MRSIFSSRFSRRRFIHTTVAAGVGFSLGATTMKAFADTAALPLITKPIPSSGEQIPVVGLGTNAYSVTASEEIAARREVLRRFPELGAKVIDTARGYGESEVVIGRLLQELGKRDEIFLATKTPNRGPVGTTEAELQTALSRLQTDRIDLLQIHNFHEIAVLFPLLQEWKRAGKVRYIGVTTSNDEQYPQLEQALNTLPLDFIQVDYSIDNRGAADAILPLAQAKRVGVLINVPLGGRRGNVLSRVAARQLPAWVDEIDVTSWAQLFLKYNISHPAVTAVIPGTTKLEHLHDNQRAARGRLPNAAQRTKIEELWATLQSEHGAAS